MTWFNRLTNITWITGITSIILLTFFFYNAELKIIGLEYSVLIFVFLPFMIYWLSYQAFTNPELFFAGGARFINPGDQPAFIKYQNNRLSETELRSITEKLDAVMNDEKPYLFPEVSLDSLSKQINIPRHSISQAVNMIRKMNFNDYINSHRIEHAKRELLNPSKQHLTIASIAFGSGFNSISTFNEAFRKFTSTTPSLFKKNSTA
jgi:AraC-like DNA-binding protein